MKKDKVTGLAPLKDCFAKFPFDIDKAPVDPAQPDGEKLGESIDKLKDDTLSGIFKATRSNAPQPVDQSAGTTWTTRHIVFCTVAVVGVIGLLLLKRHQSQQNEQKRKDTLAAHS